MLIYFCFVSCEKNERFGGGVAGVELFCSFLSFILYFLFVFAHVYRAVYTLTEPPGGQRERSTLILNFLGIVSSVS